jgi:uncharacterized protein
MIYRRFGRTELSMPVFSCGGMRYQQAWTDLEPDKIEQANQANLEATIQRAVAVGINHIETARGYGSSEMQLGWVLSQFPREQLIVQTKVAPTADPQEFRETFETSLRYLKLDYVDLLSIHGINNEELLEWTLRPGGCLEVVRELQRSGRVRFVGFATHASTQVILEAVHSGEFDYVNLHWYFMNQYNWPAIAEAARRDLGVFIISPNDKGGKLYEPPAKLVTLCQPFSPMMWNDLFCLSRPEVHTLSLGAARPSDFDEHLKVLPFFDQMEAVTAPITQRVTAEVERIVGAEFYQNWTEGIPAHEQLPGQVNVREIVRLWIFAQSLDLVEWGKMRYNLMGQAGHWFPGLKASAWNEADMRAALSGARHRERLLEILHAAHTLLDAEPKQRLSQGD